MVLEIMIIYKNPINMIFMISRTLEFMSGTKITPSLTNKLLTDECQAIMITE